MDRYASGDDAAFGDLYDALAPKLLGFVLRQTKDRARAEDFVQQTFLQMHGARDSYITGADVLPWAFAIARRLVIDGFRRARREQWSDLPSDDEAPVSSQCPDEALRSKQAAAIIQQTLLALPEPQRAAFELTKYDGLSMAQAAEALGTTVMAIKLRTHRTHQALRHALAERVLETGGK